MCVSDLMGPVLPVSHQSSCLRLSLSSDQLAEKSFATASVDSSVRLAKHLSRQKVEI